MNPTTELKNYIAKTVEPREVLPLAALFLRWPYKSGEIISKEINTYASDHGVQTRLTIYGVEDIYYQQTPVEPSNYVGFLLRINWNIYLRANCWDMLENFSNFIVLKQDVLNIEKTNREYCALPVGPNKQFVETICTMKNLSLFIPKMLPKIARHQEQNIPILDEPKVIPKERIWPWLGPIAPSLPEYEVKRTIPSETEEIELFVKAARELGQNDPKCLARMIKYRYPEVSHPMLVDLIDPAYKGNAAAKRKKGRRWLGLS